MDFYAIKNIKMCKYIYVVIFDKVYWMNKIFNKKCCIFTIFIFKILIDKE